MTERVDTHCLSCFGKEFRWLRLMIWIESRQMAASAHKIMARDLTNEERLIATACIAHRHAVGELLENPKKGDLTSFALYFGSSLTLLIKSLFWTFGFVHSPPFGPQRMSTTMAVLRGGHVLGIQQGTSNSTFGCGPRRIGKYDPF